jgi:hypothetical protein
VTNNLNTQSDAASGGGKSDLEKDLKKLTLKELKIYKSVLASFPATSHESAYNVAIQGGVKFQFYPK